MKIIGLIGGMSWESTSVYYSLLNRMVAQKFGGLHSAKVLLHSLNFAEIEQLQKSNGWTEAGNIINQSAQGLEKAGAGMILICTNTMHKVIDQVNVSVPVLHIGDCVAAKIKQAGFKRVGLLATKFTMEHDFYKSRLEEHGLSVFVPPTDCRDEVHRVIFKELCRGQVKSESRARLLSMIENLRQEKVECIILGCTELGMIITQEDLHDLPVFDTTIIHCEAALDLALA